MSLCNSHAHNFKSDMRLSSEFAACRCSRHEVDLVECYRSNRDEALIEDVSVIENQISLLCEEFEMSTGNFFIDSEDQTVETFHINSEVSFANLKVLVTRRLS
jgi:hypothetical protein